VNIIKTQEWNVFNQNNFDKQQKELNSKATFLEFGGSLNKETLEEGGEKEIGFQTTS
jgi:hypothetical protein